MVAGIAGSITIGSIANYVKNTLDFGHEYKLDEILDDVGDIITLIHSGQKYKCSALLTPRATLATHTFADAALSLPPPVAGAKVVIAGLPAAAMNSGSGTTAPQWVYVGNWKLAFKNDGVATYSLDLMAGLVNDLGAANT